MIVNFFAITLSLRFSWLHIREKAEELCIDLVDNLLEILRTVLELDTVYIKDKEIVLVILDPVLVALL